MDTDRQGGEPSCFLSELDKQGNVPDPSEMVRLESGGGRAEENAWRVFVSRRAPEQGSYDQWAPELAPAAGETLAQYQARLEGPACRTAAWTIALKAQDEAVCIGFADQDDLDSPDSTPFAEALLACIRELLA